MICPKLRVGLRHSEAFEGFPRCITYDWSRRDFCLEVFMRKFYVQFDWQDFVCNSF